MPNAIRDVDFMRLAIDEAQAALAIGEVPIGCVVVQQDHVIGRGHNLRETDQNPTSHAEIIALQEAAKYLGSWRLLDCTLYVTLEPCPMCAGALVNSRISRVVFGSADPKAGALSTLYTLGNDARLNHRFDVQSGVLADDCGRLLSGFFSSIRAHGKQKKKGFVADIDD